MLKIKPFEKKLSFEYFSVKVSGSNVDLGSVMASLSKPKKVINCNGRPFMVSHAEFLPSVGTDGCWYVEALRLRRACYPVLVDDNGDEIQTDKVQCGQWFAEKSAFLVSTDSTKQNGLVLLQNKHGVRSSCISECLTQAAQLLSSSASTSSAVAIRLIGLSRSVGMAANKLVESRSMEFYTMGVFDRSNNSSYLDKSAAWAAKQYAKGSNINLRKISFRAKAENVEENGDSLLSGIPFIGNTPYKPQELTNSGYIDIEMHDLNKDALVHDISAPEYDLRYITRKQAQEYLASAWENRLFQEALLNVSL